MNDQNAIPAVVPIRYLFAHKNFEDPLVGKYINTNTFELMLKLIQMVEANVFERRAAEDPNKHLTKTRSIT